MDSRSGEQTYGEAHVGKPETQSGTVTQYTTYLVKVRLGEDNFECRKRYSDFEWLRSAITSCFPGVRIPPIPKKQALKSLDLEGLKSGAQGLLAKTYGTDESFIEERRAGLEDFLQCILKKRELCIESQILKRFLGTATEEACEELKRKIDSVSVSSKCTKFSSIYAEHKEKEVSSDERIDSTKRFLASHTQQLREYAAGLKEVVEAQQAVTKAVSSTQTKLAALSHTESGSLSREGVSTEAREELVLGLRQHREAMQAFPAMHYDLLLAATEREVLEAEAMQEAVDSVEALQKNLEEEKVRVETMGTTLQNVQNGGEIPSTGTGVARMLGIAPKKDREERIAQMTAEYEQKQKDITAMVEFHRLARIVLVLSEIDSFFKEKTAEQRRVKDTFAGLSRKAAERLMSAWDGTAVSAGSFGYTASAEPTDIEYE
jgi:hypothetical protein